MGLWTTISSHDSWPERQAALQGLLRAQQEVLRDKRRSLRQAPPREAIEGADEEERAARELEAELDIALLEIRSRQVQEIETALRLLEEGAYGRCVDCDETILASRLHARPFATRCRDCQEVLEGDGHEPRRAGGIAPSRPDWTPFAPVRWPGSGRAPNVPRARRRHRATVVPVTRPLSYGGISL
jgi:DnaK suppressor protein